MLSRVLDRRRIAGAVREEHAVGLAREHVGRRRGRGHHLDLATGLHELVEDRALDAEVVRDHEQARVVRAHRVGLGGRDLGDEIAPVGAAVGLGGREQRVAVGDTERPGIAPASRMWRVRRRVSMPGDPGNLVPIEIAAQTFGGAPARRPAREIAHDHTRGNAGRALRRRRR